MPSKTDGKRRTTTSRRDQTLRQDISTKATDQEEAAKRRGGTPAQDWIFFASAGAIVVVALLLRLYQLGAEEVWVDEASSWQIATTSNFLRQLLTEYNPPLYDLLLRGWMKVGGQSETGLRLISAMAGTLFVAAVIWAGQQIFEPRVGLWSGAFAAVAPIHIYYSQETRAYALLTLGLILTYASLWRAVQANTGPWWALVSTSTALTLFTHYLAVFGLSPCVFLLWLWPERARWRRFGVAMLGSALLFVPWILWSFVYTSRSFVGADWIQTVWEQMAPLLEIPRSLEVFGLGSQAGLLPIQLKQFSHLVFPPSLRLLGLVLLVLLGIWVAVPWGDWEVGGLSFGKRKAWLALLLGFPLGALWLVSFVKPLYLAGRYDLVAFPAYPLLLGLAFCKLHRAKPAGALLAPLIALLLMIPVGTKLLRYYWAASTAIAPRTAMTLHTEASGGDVVVFTSLSGFPALYYLSQLGYRWEGGYCRDQGAGRQFACRMYPRESEHEPAVLDPRRILHSADAVREDVRDFMRMLRSADGTLWVVFGQISFSQESIGLPEFDSLLFRELQRLGLKLSPVKGAPWIYRTQRAG